MSLIPKRITLALSWPYQLMGILIISLIVWGQSGFELDQIRLLFIAINYLCWFTLLPWINGATRAMKSTSMFQSAWQFLLILLIHWFVSNALFYPLRFVFLDYSLLPTLNEISEYFVPSLVSRAIDLALFVGLLAWIYQNYQLQERKLEVFEKSSELQRSKLQSLKNQLNPHFLFNSMHNIASLIGQDDEMAHDLTIKLSHLLRKIMEINELEEHSLKDEWDFVQDYLAIETERFQDRLEIKTVYDDKLNSQIIPTLILQPLVENAFKHGISNAVGQTTLEISIEPKGDAVTMEVKNQVFPSSNSYSNGIGLKNLEERLESYYDGAARLSTQFSSDTFVANIQLPILQ
ncbi:sensor histidine kinase [Ekhidna sp.]